MFLINIALLAGCGTSVQRKTVYEEQAPFSSIEPRKYVVRLNVFQFEGEVGGYVEFFEQNNPAQDPLYDPYLTPPVACHYFGTTVLRGETFALSVKGPENDLFFTARAVRSTSNELTLFVNSPEEYGGMWPDQAPIFVPNIAMRLQRNLTPTACQNEK